ncbi:MAG: hypothetical protein KDB23_33590 [Planctomycetales bacterium]|nr:hypothetical protein [Planctomycetales bacterium]
MESGQASDEQTIRRVGNNPAGTELRDVLPLRTGNNLRRVQLTTLVRKRQLRGRTP